MVKCRSFFSCSLQYAISGENSYIDVIAAITSSNFYNIFIALINADRTFPFAQWLGAISLNFAENIVLVTCLRSKLLPSVNLSINWSILREKSWHYLRLCGLMVLKSSDGAMISILFANFFQCNFISPPRHIRTSISIPRTILF